MVRLALVLAALAATTLAAAAQDAETGGQIFYDYCAGCHGPDARGTGPVAELLSIETPDLTHLAERNGGTFPVLYVVYRIDGRHPLLAHGGDMPIFGQHFQGFDAPIKSESGQPIMTSRPIVDLVAWLESMQG